MTNPAKPSDPLDSLIVIMIVIALFGWAVHAFKDELWNLALQIHHTHR